MITVGVGLPPFWGKSNAGGRPNLLLQHLLDTSAVAELMWDRLLAGTVRTRLDLTCGGRGRDIFRLLAGWHDIGKASPAFQSKVPELADHLMPHGLSLGRLTKVDTGLRHERAGAHLLRKSVPQWPRSAVDWVWPLVAGHHGLVGSLGTVDQVPRRGQGDRLWEDAQQSLVDTVVEALGLNLVTLVPSHVPSRATQLAISGFVIMADWLASDDNNFPGIDDPAAVSLTLARERASRAWQALGLQRGWTQDRLLVARPDFTAGFGFPPRPGQQATLDAAAGITGPGLLIIEAPMGEGKTEAALGAVEILATRFGCDGVFVGMPTQATTDAMYARVRPWAARINPELPVALLHGKRHFNKQWRALESAVSYRGVDEYGCLDDFRADDLEPGAPSGRLPAEWLLGRKRGLLSPLAIGTVDQLLYAATRTRHVALRQAGLAGKVVVLDEVHAYDVYMSQFLFEVLRWLGDAQVPVVLLSATLPPELRRRLARAYLQGRLAQRDVDVVLPASGYPATLSVTVTGGAPDVHVWDAALHRPSHQVHVDVLTHSPEDHTDATAHLLSRELAEGGCALVLCNTVGRAQATYQAVHALFGAEAVLLHGRLTVGERADRAEQLLKMLGPGESERPARLVVVATQIAEQSFDVDADLLVSDLAPIDLLLQRCGRLHRHDRPPTQRPARLRQPRLVVTGLTPRPDAAPGLEQGSVAVYGTYPLLRSADLVLQALEDGWQVPGDVPGLVARGYDENEPVPAGWEQAVATAHEKWRTSGAVRTDKARQYLLADEDQLGRLTLAGLHDRSIADPDDDHAVAAVVRDGPESVEVILVRRLETGYATLSGRPLGPHGAAITDDQVLQEVLRSAVRLPSRPTVTAAAQQLRPLPGWDADAWLRHTPALILDAAGQSELGGRVLTYDPELGLIDEPAR